MSRIPGTVSVRKTIPTLPVPGEVPVPEYYAEPRKSARIGIVSRLNRMDYLLALLMDEVGVDAQSLPLFLVKVYNRVEHALYYIDYDGFSGYLYGNDIGRYYSGRLMRADGVVYVGSRHGRRGAVVGNLVSIGE